MSNEVAPSGLDSTPTSPASRSAIIRIIIGTAVMGASGFVVLVVTAAAFGAEDYALFGVFWAALYFIVVVVTGAQHESTRASLAPLGYRRTSLLYFAGSLSFVLFATVAGSSLWWSDAAFGGGHRQLGILVGIGCAGFALICVFAGCLAGAGRWGAFAALMIVEGGVRAGAICLAMATSASVELAAWVVVLTYPFTLLVVAVAVSRPDVDIMHVSSSFGELWGNTAKTMVASAGVGALITGFPFLLSVASRDESAASVGALTLALMLTRAPLLVPLMGMQSFLVSAFSRSDESPWRLLGRLLACTVVVAALLSLAAGLVGTRILTGVFGEDFSVAPSILALLVGSSGCLAAMALAAPALIARGLLAANAMAWIVATIFAAAALVLAPWALGWRAAVSLIVGPAVGLMIQLMALRRASTTLNR